MPLLRLLGNVIKKKVAVPQFKPVDISTVENQAIQQNLASLPEAEKYAAEVNRFNQETVDTQFANKIPGLAAIDTQAASNIQSELAGELPQDVVDQIYRKSTAQALEGGYGGSQAAKNLTSRDLGLTSLNLAEHGLSNAMNWITNIRSNRLAPSMNPAGLFLTAAQRVQHITSERDKALTRDYLSNQLRAAQSWKTYMGQALGELDDLAVQALSSYFSGGMMNLKGTGNANGGGGASAINPGNVQATNFSSAGAEEAGGWAMM